jgi:hypothetical protein
MSYKKRILALLAIFAAVWVPCRAEGVLDDCGRARGLSPFLIEELNALDTTNDYNVTSAYGIVIELNQIVRKYGPAGLTECNKDIAFTKKISEVANTEQSKIRQNASELLLNVISPDTMCAVFDSMLDPNTKPITRANLWRAISLHSKIKGLNGNYATLKAVIDNQRPILKASGNDGVVALRFLDDLSTLSQQRNDTLKLTPLAIERCKALPNLAPIFPKAQ